MLQQLLRTLLAFSALLTSAAPAGEFRILEQAIETSTLKVSIPTDESGSMAVKACQSCTTMVLRLTPESTYRVGRSAVSFDEFASYVRSVGTRNLDIFYDAKNGTITRLVVAGELSGRSPQR